MEEPSAGDEGLSDRSVRLPSLYPATTVQNGRWRQASARRLRHCFRVDVLTKKLGIREIPRIEWKHLIIWPMLPSSRTLSRQAPT